jgi:RNA-binding protein YlmH
MFSNFLDTREQSLIRAALGDRAIFYGGFDDAERCMVGFMPDYETEFPITAISVTLPDGASAIEHRSVLGSIMGLGIERSVIGDIVITDKHRAVIFIKSEFYNYFDSNLLKIGRETCSISKIDPQELTVQKNTETFTVSVASLRLDCFTAAAAKTSREKAVILINSKKVFLNRLETCDPSKSVSEGDQLIIRGIGKFNLKSINGTTRKGRISAEIEKYI